MDPRLKSIKIKAGVVKRTGKEKLSYRKEADQYKAKVERMKEEGKEEIQIKKMTEVIQESLSMIPECHRRLEKFMGELKTLLDQERDEFSETEEFQEAEKIMSMAEEQLKAN